MDDGYPIENHLCQYNLSLDLGKGFPELLYFFTSQTFHDFVCLPFPALKVLLEIENSKITSS